MRFKDPRAAFSLLELLATLSTLLILVSLLTPAVQQVREGARRSICSSRLKELSLACQLFESAKRCLPPGYNGPEQGDFLDLQSTSWVGSNGYLLPYIAGSSSSKLQLSGGPAWWLGEGQQHDSHAAFYSRNLSGFTCPSDGQGESMLLLATFVKGLSPNSLLLGSHNNASSNIRSGRANYFGSMGANGKVGFPSFDKLAGPFFNRSRTKMRDISDGTSHTILYGEGTGRWANSSSHTGRESQLHWCAGPLSTRSIGVASSSSYDQFDSLHPGGVVYAFCDGSTTFLTHDIDQGLREALGSMAGDEIVATRQLSGR